MHHKRAFSLLELAIALMIAGMVAGMAMKMTATTDRNECYAASKAQAEKIKQAIDRFALSNRRFPLPARRYVGTDSPLYGKEVLLADINDLDSVLNANGPGTIAVFGTVPYAALNLSMDDSIDCWGNKITYIVTKDLTSTATLTDTVKGAITISVANNVRISTQNPPTPDGFGYAVIVHGEDQLGAVKANWSDYTAANMPQNPAAARLTKRKWCSADGTPKTINCLASNANLMAAQFNNGNSPTKYFDDVIIFRGKPWKAQSGGKVYCWGTNSNGALGNNLTTGDRWVPTPINLPTTPSNVTSFSSFSAGYNHDCAIGNNGSAYCWGKGDDGVLGNGDTNNKNVPTLVAMPAGVGATNISIRNNHSCAIGDNGSAYCWGDNGSGQLGINNNSTKWTPELVAPLPAGAGALKSIVVGHEHTCALDNAGKAYCWGSNSHGQLGIGPFGNSSIAREVDLPFAAPVGFNFTSISAGQFHTCAIGNDNKAYCWGSNSHGQLGTFFPGNKNQPTVVRYLHLGITGFKRISAGREYYTCAIGSDDRPYCWGENSYGELGIGLGNYTQQSWATAVAVPFGVKYSDIGTGHMRTCGITTSGQAYCWGDNSAGQLGNNSNAPSTIPVQALPPAGLNKFLSISGGGASSCAIIVP